MGRAKRRKGRHQEVVQIGVFGFRMTKNCLGEGQVEVGMEGVGGKDIRREGGGKELREKQLLPVLVCVK